MSSFLAGAVLLLLQGVPERTASQPASRPAFAVRSAWHRPAETSEAEVEATLRRAAAGGLRRLDVEAISEGQTFYPSPLYESQKGFERFDALAAFARLGPRHGIEIYGWVHVFFAGFAQARLVREHPDWLQRDAAGSAASFFEQFEGKGYHFLCPASEPARAHILSGLAELAAKGVAGIQLDYIRYPISRSEEGKTQQFCACPRCAGDTAADREKRILDFVTEVRRRFPRLRLSAAVFPDLAHARSEKYQDWSRFEVDELAFMSYDRDPSRVGEWIRKAPWKGPIVAGLAPFLKYPPETLIAQIRAAKDAGAAGVAFFALHSMDDALLARIAKELP